MTADLSFPSPLSDFFLGRQQRQGSAFEFLRCIFSHPPLVQPFPPGAMHRACVPAKGGQTKAASLLCNRLKRGLLPPLGGRINGLAGRYTPTTNPSPNVRLNTGSLVGGPNSTCVPENVLWCPSFVDRSPRRSHSPWPPSNERESECRPLIGCIFLLSHWLERGWAGSSTCTAPLGHLQPLEVDFWRHDMP